ncbi:hypothetical protein M8818_005374 [Zalaria obscura]|uniref:Uncharacterized protein n=1 Tax=Zalaria obscura TaxID=2024903 RepID=A0ACC3SA54_9PEZI
MCYSGGMVDLVPASVRPSSDVIRGRQEPASCLCLFGYYSSHFLKHTVMAGRWILGASSVITTLSAFVSAAPAAYSNASGSVSDSPAAAATLAVAESFTQGGSNSGAYHSPAYLTGGSNLGHPRLSQQQTNGNSVLGTSKAPKLGQWVQSSGQPMPAGTPWGTASASNTNYYTNTPNTGMTRFYDFTITQGVISPDGVNKTGILINGAFPGPTIEANWGDWIQVTLNNQLADEGTSLHWHGLLQKATPWMDGVPGVQQCPIAPGSSFTYRFKADLYGTSWYHSHYSAQYAGGALGAMIIHGPTNAQYDEDLGPIILSDWYHEDYYTLVEQVMSPASANAGAPTSNNNLINGKMNYPCENTTLPCTPNAGISKFSFTSGKKDWSAWTGGHIPDQIDSGLQSVRTCCGQRCSWSNGGLNAIWECCHPRATPPKPFESALPLQTYPSSRPASWSSVPP